MGTLFGFAVGYIIGARAGREGFDEVMEALRAVRSSEEFRALTAAVTSHAKGTAANLGRWLQAVEDTSAEELLARARERARERARRN